MSAFSHLPRSSVYFFGQTPIRTLDGKRDFFASQVPLRLHRNFETQSADAITTAAVKIHGTREMKPMRMLVVAGCLSCAAVVALSAAPQSKPAATQSASTPTASP